MGSTSLAMTTSWAFFFSMRVVTVLTPCLTTAARLSGLSSLPAALRYRLVRLGSSFRQEDPSRVKKGRLYHQFQIP